MELKPKTSTNIGIVGLGLIGGSLGLDLQKLGYRVHGITHREETAKKARERKLAQVISTDTDTLKNCSIIFIALPLEQLLHPKSHLIDALPKNAVITDVGSVKVPVLEVWEKLHPRFVASHPMTGTEESGVNSGKYNLFQGKPWVVTPNKETDRSALETIHQIALLLGCKWISCEAAIHDQAVGLISHLPVFISAAFLKTLNNEKDTSLFDLAKDIASSGFSDTSRVGGGNPQLGTSMAKFNKTNLLKSLLSFRKALDLIENSILSENWNEIEKELINTQMSRKELISKS
tara:strand:- start:157 stop:1026 length:870 start_codon:yes stop_codon:yes gene_type:complete